jgi:hypothetical protein
LEALKAFGEKVVKVTDQSKESSEEDLFGGDFKKTCYEGKPLIHDVFQEAKSVIQVCWKELDKHSTFLLNFIEKALAFVCDVKPEDFACEFYLNFKFKIGSNNPLNLKVTEDKTVFECFDKIEYEVKACATINDLLDNDIDIEDICK